ncbi:cytidylate kinase [bacterium BMS3Abin10]|nr:cytidylate kinase [bacterium BMS3Abin10]GBE37625.1 cytidylate kinase [bacterium BMS3Bbin08]HDH49885.1 (d)CMP kinase [Nitrospirota bacterium]HDK41632.1 (d)CMP kinase [Nitrospirota bacterium]
MRDVITIDGPSGAGKSTVSRLLAKKLGYRYLDTGALYRAVAWKVHAEGTDPESADALTGLLKKTRITCEDKKVMVDGADVTTQIRTPEIGELSSRLSAIPVVRKYLFEMQRHIGLEGNVVIEGRDIGTVIFPESENKFFIDASPEERARRRYEELKNKGLDVSLYDILDGIKKRDRRDSTRQSAPLKKTGSMVYVDTSSLSIDEVILNIMEALKTS